jgi:mannose/fructose-specific phosphotransferase system component IIA
MLSKRKSLPGTSGVISVTDILGKTVWKQNVRLTFAEEHVNIDVDHLKAGMYIVRLETDKYKVEEKMVISK